MRTLKSLAFLQIFAVATVTHAAAIDRVDPPSWWVGFQAPTVELLVKGDDAAHLSPRIDYPGVSVVESHGLPNPHYLSVTLAIAPDAAVGAVPIDFQADGTTVAHLEYTLSKRENGSRDRRGFDAHDTVYLVMPDRFANGDPGNDAAVGTRDRVDRADPDARHGGDLAGIRAHLDYLDTMGYTQLWLTPALENDMPAYSYHGYAITDHYRIDPRFGSNEDYRALGRDARAKGIGLIEDVVINHIGSSHWWMKDLPDPSWISTPSFEPTNHAHKVMIDPHAAPSDRARFINGWFDTSMPDLHPATPSLGNYLIQNAIWWIEYAGLSGLRIDTYPYTDKIYTAEYCRRILAEYPRLNIVGEENYEYSDPVLMSYWQAGHRNNDGYVSTLPTLMDFPSRDALMTALTTPERHGGGLRLLYETLADDVAYADPMRLLVLADNHDTDRAALTLQHNDRALRMAMTVVATLRGIPQVYYGTELAWANEKPGDGDKRRDFPGGFAGDTANAFTGEGLDAASWEMRDFIRKLFSWRRDSKAVQEGSFLHYVPDHDVYVYFRLTAGETVMVMLNNRDDVADVPLARFRETLGSARSGRDPIGGGLVVLGDRLRLEPKSSLIVDIGRTP